jgi:hypothetical protein
MEGIGDISIPSGETLRGLAGYKTSEGLVTYPELAKGYRGILESAAQYEKGEIPQEAMRKQLLEFAPEVARARALSITGVGGLLRNRVPGSAYLTAMIPPNPDIQQALPRGVVGISEDRALKMMETMEQVYGKEAMARQRRQFFQGEILPAILGRHPYTDPYSSHITGVKIIPGMESDKIYVPEEYRSLTATLGGKTGKPSTIRLSSLVGMGADVDSDALSIILAGPQLAPKMQGYLQDPKNMEAYEQYSIRQQLLRAKAPPETSLTLNELMAGAAEKLGVTKRPGELGKVSLPIQRARAAILSGAGGLSTQEAMDALGFTSMMEQLPISSKHISAADAPLIRNLFSEVSAAYEKMDPVRMQAAAERMLARSGPETQAALREGFTAHMGGEGAGRDIFIPGVNMERATENIAKSMRALENLEGQGLNPIRERELLRGRFTPALEEIEKMFSTASLKNSSLGGFFTHGVPAGPMAEMTSGIMAIANKMIAAGKAAIPHAKPLLIGTAAAIGIAALLSPPPLSVDPRDTVPPRPNLKSGSGGATLNVDMVNPERQSGSPTAPDLTRSMNTARVSAPGGLARQVRVYGNSGGRVDYDSLSQQLRQSLGGRASVHSTVDDRRSSLTPQKLSDILNNR